MSNHSFAKDYWQPFSQAYRITVQQYPRFVQHLALSLLLSIFFAGAAALSPYLLGQLASDQPKNIVWLAAALVFSWLLHKVLEQCANIMNAYITSQCEASMCQYIYKHIIHLPHARQSTIDAGVAYANIDRSMQSFANINHALFLTICPIFFEIAISFGFINGVLQRGL